MSDLFINVNDKIEGTEFTWAMALYQKGLNSVVAPTRDQVDNIKRQALELQKIKEVIEDFVITSWLRTPEENQRVGGAKDSMHLTGLATDFVPLTMTPDEARSKIKQAKIYPGRFELNAKTWVHCDLKNNIDFNA